MEIKLIISDKDLTFEDYRGIWRCFFNCLEGSY